MQEKNAVSGYEKWHALFVHIEFRGPMPELGRCDR